MRVSLKSIILATLVLALAAAVPTMVHAQGGAMIEVTDSRKMIETRIAELLKERLNVNSQLTAVNNDPEDLRVLLVASGDPETGQPAVRFGADTKVMTTDDQGVASQVVVLFSSPVVTLNTSDELSLLRWVNRVNMRNLPFRVQLTRDQPSPPGTCL